MMTEAELLKAYLAERDVACPKCGYSLKGCVAEKCPECGATFALGVHCVLKSGVPFVVGLGGILFGLGFYLPMVCYMFATPLMSTRRGGRTMLPEEIEILVAVTVLVLALILWLLFGRIIARYRGPGVWIGCSAVALVSAVSPAVFFLMIR